MATVLNYIAESPGAACAIVSSYFLGWIQQAAGTAQAVSAVTWQTATLPYTASVTFSWTDMASNPQSVTIVIYLSFLAAPSFGLASTVVSPQYLVQSQGSSNRMVVDASQAGLVGVTRADLVTMWVAATSGFVVSMLEYLSHIAPIDGGQSYSSDATAYNIWREFSVQNYLFGGQIATFQWALQALNAGNGTLVTEGLADESTITGQQLTTGGAISSIANSLQVISTMEPVFSFNHGGAVISVQQGVVG